MDNLNLADLNLSKEESRNLARYLVEYLAKREILKTINVNQMINYCKL